MSLRRLLALLLLAALAVAAGCSTGGDSGDDGAAQDPPPDPTPSPGPPPAPRPGTVTTNPTVPRTSTPPVGVTWHVGITENVPLSRMQSLFASFVAANNAIWQVSEGQVRVDKVVFFDNIGPGVTAMQFIMTNGAGVNLSNVDIVVWPQSNWDIPAGGAVSTQPGQGRNNRLMIIPENVQTFVLLHEAGHLLFQLSWTPGPLLVDEYQDGVQDQACVMESQNLPQRWCSSANHTYGQSSQPRACWEQILIDYPNFRHTGADSASGMPPSPTAEYNDVP